MSRRRQLLVLAFLLLLLGGLVLALTQPSCVRSEAMLATSCMRGYEPRQSPRWLP
jgi:hypothetical protein